MNITTPYYEDNTRVSNSAIGWFLKKGPSYFHKMLTGEIAGEKTTAMDRGSMIHEYILQPEEFQKHYVVWDKSRPSSVQQEKFCQALASSLEIEPNRAILDAYKEAYSTAGKSEDKMLSEGLKIASTLKNYIDFLKENDRRIMITPWDYKMLEKIKHNISSHKLAKNLIWPGGHHDYNMSKDQMIPGNTWHEFHINWEWKDLKDHVSCKSLLDGLTLDFRNKRVVIYDLKTTQKLWHFEDSMTMYDYERQLVYYSMAVEWYLINECGVDPEDYVYCWKKDFYIIGIDTTGSYEIRVFKVVPKFYETKKKDLISVESKIVDALRDIAWHQRTGKWDHSRSYYEGDGSESLNL